MHVSALDPLIRSFYRDRYVEDARLTRTPQGRIEFVRTQQLLRRRMPAVPAQIADVWAAAPASTLGGWPLAGLGALDEDAAHHAAELIRTGVNEDDPAGFTTAYFHRPEELAQELAGAGLLDVTVAGVEGPSVPTLDAAGLEGSELLMASALRCAELVEHDPALINASPHLLAFGRCPGSDVGGAGSGPP